MANDEAGRAWRHTAVAAACVLLAAVATGCGEEEGAAEGATVTAYVEAPLCAGAKQELASQDGRAGDLKVQAVCLPSASSARKLSLATLGANARRATEDSTTVAYLEAPNPKSARFTEPILESAGIARISQGSGNQAMARLLEATEAADPDSLRESVQEDLNQTPSA